LWWMYWPRWAWAIAYDLFLSLPITVLLWLSSLQKAGQDAMPL
jgi:hypothetical protein